MTRKNPSDTGSPQRIALVIGLFVLLLGGCGSSSPGGVITVVVRACVLEGTTLASLSQPDRNNAVVDMFNQVNTQVWSQAQISFLACCQDIPVVTDPDPNVGVPGTIEVHLKGTDQMRAARDECAAAWASKGSVAGSGFTQGPVVILVHAFWNAPPDTLGVTGPPTTRPDLCVAPRTLAAADVRDLYLLSIEQSGLHFLGDSAIQTLAHELGHTLLLWHGDGLDNNHNGADPPNPGPRLFDVRCDLLEASNEGGSLMAHGGNVGKFLLTPLQIELAREAAQVWPGHVGP